MGTFALELNNFLMEINANTIKEEEIEVSRIQYINSIGAIIGNHVLLYSPTRLLIDIESIRKVEIHKTRNFFYNLFFVACAIPLFYLLANRKFTLLETILISIIATVLIVFAFAVKNSKYKLLINKFDANFIEIEIERQAKDDAKGIARLVNKKVKQRRK